MTTRQIQQDLIELGYGSLVVHLDGIPGAKTLKAVKAFQKDAQLVSDGIPGIKTKAALASHKKNVGKNGTKNFKISEFASPDVKQVPAGGMDADLLLKLEYLRWKLGGKSIIINSGYRTKTFNAKIGGYKYSNHMTGHAADIKVPGVAPATVQRVAAEIFNGLGRYKNFTHVDTDSKRVHFTGAY